MTNCPKILFICVAILLASCTNRNQSKESGDKPLVLCTTGILGDAVRNILEDRVEIVALMGPGVDPHLYKATQGDIRLMNEAAVILYNGLYLEGKLDELLSRMHEKKRVISFASGVQDSLLLGIQDRQYEQEVYDPHIWFDPYLWSEGIKALSTELASVFPEWGEEIRVNGAEYVREIRQTDSMIANLLNEIPRERRVLVTSHDAFSYFGKRYGIEVHALQGISTASDYGIRDRKLLSDLIIDRRIPALFIETSVDPKPILGIIEDCRQRGIQTSLGGELYSDALGEPDGPAGTYLGMLEYNAETIFKGLKSNGNEPD